MHKEVICGNCESFITSPNYTFMSIREKGDMGKCKTTGRDVLSTSKPGIEPFEKSDAVSCRFIEKASRQDPGLLITTETLELVSGNKENEDYEEYQIYSPPVNNYIH